MLGKTAWKCVFWAFRPPWLGNAEQREISRGAAEAGGEIWYNLNLIIAEGKMKMKYVVYVAIATLLAGCVFADTAVALMRRVEEFRVVVLACALFA